MIFSFCVYDIYMHKLKIFITVLFIYEFIVITILQIPRYCISVFNLNFCEYGTFKYFLLCVACPILFGIFIWWIPDIVKLFCKHNCVEEQPKPETIHDVLSEIISSKDIERFITAAIVMGIQKFTQTHPKTTAVFDNILDLIKKTNTNKNIK